MSIPDDTNIGAATNLPLRAANLPIRAATVRERLTVHQQGGTGASACQPGTEVAQ